VAAAEDQLIRVWLEQVEDLLVMQALMVRLVQIYEVVQVVKTPEAGPEETVGQRPQLLSTAAPAL
jgi:hypothetical protein